MKKIKFNHIFDQSEEIIAIKKKARGLIGLAEYKTAYNYLLKESKNYPTSYLIASLLATLNAEDAFVLPDKQKKKHFALAAKKLRQLLYYSKGATELLRTRNINEYYWFAELHKKQYLFGVKLTKKGDENGFYSQGVGAANYAYKLIIEGKTTLGLKWAQKSQIAWEEYFVKVDKDYHDPWYWYALALGLQGKNKEMEKALKKSSKLAKKDLNAPAFKKLRRMVSVVLQPEFKKENK